MDTYGPSHLSHVVFSPINSSVIGDRQCLYRQMSKVPNHCQGIPQQPGNRTKWPSYCIFPGYFVFKNGNVKVKVKYGFVLYTGLSFGV